MVDSAIQCSTFCSCLQCLQYNVAVDYYVLEYLEQCDLKLHLFFMF